MIIEFSKTWNESEDERLEAYLDTLPDPDDLDTAGLEALRDQIESLISELDKAEPRNENSDEYDLWADRHEDLEDILDEILDRLEGMN